MHSSANTIYTSAKAKIYSAIILSLAVMVLVFSCPLKRLLESNSVPNISSAIRTNQTNINENNIADFNASDYCFAANNKMVPVKPGVSQQHKLPAPSSPANCIQNAGLTPGDFLRGIDYKYHFLSTFYSSSLPLFLKNCSLLI
jgi:hypothetical protein